jgi:hypothetical protein
MLVPPVPTTGIFRSAAAFMASRLIFLGSALININPSTSPFRIAAAILLDSISANLLASSKDISGLGFGPSAVCVHTVAVVPSVT